MARHDDRLSHSRMRPQNGRGNGTAGLLKAGFTTDRSATQARRLSRTSCVPSLSPIAVGRLSSAASQAVDTLVQLLSPHNKPSVRLNAAKAILLQLGPLSELGELRARIDRLERR